MERFEKMIPKYVGTTYKMRQRVFLVEGSTMREVEVLGCFQRDGREFYEVMGYGKVPVSRLRPLTV